MQAAECAALRKDGPSAAWYEISDHFSLGEPLVGKSVAVWAPIIPDTDRQRVLDFRLDAPEDVTFAHDGAHGNLVMHFAAEALAEPAAFALHYTVETRVDERPMTPECVGEIANPAAFAPWLGPEQHVTVDAETAKLARDLVGTETNILEQARILYKYVIGHMAYDAAQQSWVGSSSHALTCSIGNCNDIHALFISLARSVDIPTRLVLGQALEPPPPGEEACDLCGYHCWAEFFAPGLGWIPVDASCACKYGKTDLFGTLELNHIAWSTGRDLVLSPPQKGDPLLYFAGPYAEVDGEPFNGLGRHVSFNEL